jgi:hypothetical protein
MKKCCRCGENKDESGFGKCKREKSGLRRECRTCHTKSTVAWRENNKDKVKDRYLRYTYGITLEQYKEMFKQQEGRCAICPKHQSELPTDLCVDHDHITNKVRGLLCDFCNVSLGNFNDSKETLLKAIAYLERY